MWGGGGGTTPTPHIEVVSCSQHPGAAARTPLHIYWGGSSPGGTQVWACAKPPR